MSAVARSMAIVRGDCEPSADALADALPTIGGGVASTLRRLAHDTTVARTADALTQLEGIRQHLVRLRAALIREVAQ